jgi:BTB/POZ domain
LSTDEQPKNVLAISVATRNFLFILIYYFFSLAGSTLTNNHIQPHKMFDPRSADSYDVKFLVGPEKRQFQANKFALGYISTVFHRMFFSNFPSEDEIVVPDVDAGAFSVMMNSISGQAVTVNAENIAQVFYAAEKYDLQQLRQICSNFVVNMVDKTNALTILNTYHQYNESDINEKCLSIILDDPILFFNKPEFVQASSDVVRSICKPTYINCGKQNVKNALFRWMEKNGLEKYNNTEDWFQLVESHFQITKDELESKIMRQNVFQQFNYSVTEKEEITTSFTLEEPYLFLHGFGLVMGKVRKETFNFHLEIGGLSHCHRHKKFTAEKLGPKNVVSIRDIFLAKTPLGLHKLIRVRIQFEGGDIKRPCIQRNNQDSFVSHLILSK